MTDRAEAVAWVNEALAYHKGVSAGRFYLVPVEHLRALIAELVPSEEEVAKAIHLSDEPVGEPTSIAWDGGLLEDTRERYRQYARAAIAALRGYQ